jgi:hypothetical protein
VTVHPTPGPIARVLWLVVDTFRPPVVFEGTAKLCDSEHLFIAYAGQEWPRTKLHVDVDGMLHNRGQQTTTVVELLDQRAAGQRLFADNARGGLPRDLTLEPGGKRERVDFCLYAPEGEEVAGKEGDVLTFKLRLTRGGLRKPVAKVKLEGALGPPEGTAQQ